MTYKKNFQDDLIIEQKDLSTKKFIDGLDRNSKINALVNSLSEENFGSCITDRSTEDFATRIMKDIQEREFSCHALGGYGKCDHLAFQKCNK